MATIKNLCRDLLSNLPRPEKPMPSTIEEVDGDELGSPGSIAIVSGSAKSSIETNSGENLAKSVIDIQLKEKEIENLNLKDQLATLSDEKANLEWDLIAQSETITALKKEIARLNEQNDENRKLKKGILQSTKKVEAMRKDYELKITTISDDLKAARDAREEFQQMLEAERASFENLRGDLEQETLAFRTRIADLQTELDEMQTLLNSKIQKEIRAADRKRIALAKFVKVKKDLKALKENMQQGQ